MPVSYTITHDVSMLNLCCEKYRRSNPMEKADHIGRTPFVYTYCVAFLSWRWGYSTAIQVSKRLHLTMGKGVVVNRTGIRLWVHDAHIKPSLLTSNFHSWQQGYKKLHAYLRVKEFSCTVCATTTRTWFKKSAPIFCRKSLTRLKTDCLKPSFLLCSE